MKVTIIGAGLAGLACARRLTEHNVQCQLLEKSSTVGGRVKSKIINGYCVDVGFQVLLNAYPALQTFEELANLPVHPFPPGARIILDHRLHTLSDPFRNPADALPSVVTPVVSIQDKLLMWQLAAELSRRPLSSIWDEPDQTILRFLKRRGFTDKAIELFFRPFVGGITLDESLESSAALFKFVWSMLSKGIATSPSGGMQSIPDAMAKQLKSQSVDITFGFEVTDVESDTDGLRIVGSSGSFVSDIVVLATDVWTLSKLLPTVERPPSRSQRTLWLSVDRAIECGPSLILNPDCQSPIMTIAPMHSVDEQRAPTGTSLFAITIRDAFFDESTNNLIVRFKDILQRTRMITPDDQISIVEDQLVRMAQFVQKPSHFQKRVPMANLPAGLHICGEHLGTSSINGALQSGTMVADQIMRTLSSQESL